MIKYRIIDDMSIDGDALAELISSLPEWRREKAMLFKFLNGKRECAMSYSLLCDILREDFDIPLQPSFVEGEHGKPVMHFSADMPSSSDEENVKKLSFNMSHCKHAVACVVSDEGEVGIDVECLGRYKQQLAEYCMSEEELLSIDDAEDSDLQFTLLWTKKEALLKYTGEGITDDLKNCLTSARSEGVDILSGYNKEKGYAWSLAHAK
ncbi:MAG: 4'-phosphopantetheinyl transferase superfamily protein [Prevotella sp.]|nr:4'-phosphopantetheinyl transferase superfamily protein [Candidatus Prevotella equi]